MTTEKKLVIKKRDLLQMRLIHYPVLYINLAKDIKRKFALENSLQKLGMKYTRIEAVNGRNLVDQKYRNEISRMLNVSSERMTPEFWLSRKNFKTMCSNSHITLGRVGCYLSHVKCLKHAIDNDYEAVFIMEDDCKPLKNFYDRFVVPRKADIVYTGGYFWKGDKFKSKSSSPMIKIDIDNFKMVGCYGYVIPNKKAIKNIYDVLMSVFLPGKGRDKHPDWRSGKVRLRATNVDVMIVNYFQKYGNCYVMNPVKTAVRESPSILVDNRKRYKLSEYLNPKDEEMLEEL